MPTLQRANEDAVVRISTEGQDVEALLGKEWLLTNERGSYAASTIIGCNTSGYHGLLVGSLNPPVHRVMALANCLEMVIAGARVFRLSTFEFSDRLAPSGYTALREFRRSTGAHFLYRVGPLWLEKSVYLARDNDTVFVEYAFDEVTEPAEFVVRPFVGLRDFHMLQRSYAALVADRVDAGVLVRHDVPGSCELLFDCPTMRFESDPQWWFNFTYRVNGARQQDASEDLWTPGFFKGRIEETGRIVFWARLGQRHRSRAVSPDQLDTVKSDLQAHRDELLEKANAQGSIDRCLSLAAAQFVVRRAGANAEQSTILAGFPWFADWGRDAFIALPGLLLATGRHEEAKSVLCTFAGVIDDGMIPNRFDERSGTAYFNSVDASLWFIHAAFQYLSATADEGTLMRELLAAIRWIIDSYQNGTRFGIRADVDGLVMAGDRETQLTWMDAKCDGMAFTPRWGKAVEVNALWHHALCLMTEFCQKRYPSDAVQYGRMAERVGRSFRKVFWNETRGYLNDTVMPDGSADASLRPNQIFAVSLPHGPSLSRQQQRAIVDVVEKELLTPYGLRTLNPHAESYRGRYEGPLRQRDEAYHQGTVWPYLIGAFVEAYLKVHDFSPKSKTRAARWIEPLTQHLVEDGCLGSISEIFDGDAPHTARGCHAQAWSVGEVLRALHLTRNGHS